MRHKLWTIWVVSVLSALPAQASTYSIPVEKLDSQKVYFGSSAGFDKPGHVDYEAIVRATPEFEEVTKKKIQAGTGKYWILLSQASDRAVKTIAEVGQESGYDFIAAQGYLGSLEPPIPAEDITQLILDKLDAKKEARRR